MRSKDGLILRLAHNPEVVGSNPTPATNSVFRRPGPGARPFCSLCRASPGSVISCTVRGPRQATGFMLASAKIQRHVRRGTRSLLPGKFANRDRFHIARPEYVSLLSMACVGSLVSPFFLRDLWCDKSVRGWARLLLPPRRPRNQPPRRKLPPFLYLPRIHGVPTPQH